MGRLIEKELAGIKLAGFSLAGEETVVAAPELNICFDVGRAPREIISIDNVCLSHGHMDHAAGVAYYLSQRNFVGNAPGRVICHVALAGAIQRLMGVWADIEQHTSPGVIVGVEPLEDVPIRRGLFVRPFEVNHAASALGFSVIEVRHKLRPEFHGKTGPQLVALKREGVEIERQTETTLVTYTGDTALGKFMEHDFVRNSRVLVVECTFFDTEHISRARAGQHIHVCDLPELLRAAPESQVLLTHLTKRTDVRQAKKILAQALGRDDMDRVTFLMDRPTRKYRQTQPSATARQDA